MKNKKITNRWYIDRESDYRWIYHRLKSHIFTVKTEFQKVELIDTFLHGRVIVLDNKIQSAESDEFIYHEALVHPAMITHPNPENILILGGGEGATLREVLKHATVKKVVMVDIDRTFVQLCKKHLKKWHKGSFGSPKVSFIFDDAKEFIQKIGPEFDVVITDISDPVEGGPAQQFYTKKLYSRIKKSLKPEGILVTHATEVLYTSNGNTSAGIYKMLVEIFPKVRFYYEYIPSFGTLWGFAVASSRYRPEKISFDVLFQRLKERDISDLSYYDPETHRRLFCLPKCVRNNLGIK